MGLVQFHAPIGQAIVACPRHILGMEKTLTTIAIALSLAGCAGFDGVFHPHIRDMDKQIGAVERYEADGKSALILWERADRVTNACHEIMPYTDAGGCTIVRNDGKPSPLLTGCHCLIVSPPNQYIFQWEWGRCTGANRDKGVTGTVTMAALDRFKALFHGQQCEA